MENIKLLTDEEIAYLEYRATLLRGATNGTLMPEELLQDYACHEFGEKLGLALDTIRELKKDLELADFLSDKLEEKIMDLEKENEELKRVRD